MASNREAWERRSAAAQACVDRFLGQRLDFKSADCVRLVRLALVKQGVSVKPLKGLQWRSKAGALKAMKESGFASLAEGMDATGCVRIAPAQAVTGDIVALPTAEGCPFGCSLMVNVGNRRLLGLTGEGAFAVVEPSGMYVAAWRVEKRNG